MTEYFYIPPFVTNINLNLNVALYNTPRDLQVVQGNYKNGHPLQNNYHTNHTLSGDFIIRSSYNKVTFASSPLLGNLNVYFPNTVNSFTYAFNGLSFFNGYVYLPATSYTNVQSGINFAYMFQNCYVFGKSITNIPNSGNNFTSMFANCISFNQQTIDIPNLKTNTSVVRMFQYCTSLNANNIYFGYNVNNAYYALFNCTGLRNCNIYFNGTVANAQYLVRNSAYGNLNIIFKGTTGIALSAFNYMCPTTSSGYINIFVNNAGTYANMYNGYLYTSTKMNWDSSGTMTVQGTTTPYVQNTSGKIRLFNGIGGY